MDAEPYSDISIFAIPINMSVIANTSVVHTLQLSWKCYSIYSKDYSKFCRENLHYFDYSKLDATQ